jgi:hypothetical protein
LQFIRTSILALLIGYCWLLPLPASAQSAISADSGATLEMLQNRLQEAEASAEFDEAVKSNLIDLYRKSISLVEQRRSYEASTAEFVRGAA